MKLLALLFLSFGSLYAAPADGVRVSVLGYHDFADEGEQTEMRIRSSKFRAQMQTLKDLGLPVITMSDFEAWKAGKMAINDKSVVITIDDGWKSVYTYAYPILREFGFPFHLFLYRDYVDGGGRALTTEMIEEMKKHGASIGSHSVSHPYPATVKDARRKGPEAYETFLRHEMGESKRFLESKFGEPVDTYAYPGGFQTEEMFPLAKQVGYEHLFTVQPAKVRRDHDNFSIPRYIILGTHDSIFELAISFSESAVTAANSRVTSLPAQATAFPVLPLPGAITEDRLPVISVDLSKLSDLDLKSLKMNVSGFGEVPATYHSETGILSWKVNRPLRVPSVQVQVTWKDNQNNAPITPLRWTFRLDREAAYLPREPLAKPPGAN